MATADSLERLAQNKLAAKNKKFNPIITADAQKKAITADKKKTSAVIAQKQQQAITADKKNTFKPVSRSEPTFGLKEIAEGLQNPTIASGGATDVQFGKDLADSTIDLFSGKADAWDYLNLGAAGLSIAGLNLGPAVRTAKTVKQVADVAKAGSNFNKAFKAQKFTDYGGSSKAYENPDFLQSVNTFGQIDRPQATLAAETVLENLPRRIAVEKAALRASEYWAKNPGFNESTKIYDELLNADFVKQAGIQAYIPNMYSIVNNRTPQQIAEAIRAAEAAGPQAEGFLKSPFLAPARLRDTAETALQRSNSGFTSGFTNSVVNAGAKTLPGGPAALLANRIARHRSTENISDVMHPRDVPVSSGRLYGPGTYFAQTPEDSQRLFSGFGENVYKMNQGLGGALKTMTGKGYLDISDPKAQAVLNSQWDDQVIQDLIKEGFIGLRHGNALTNWLVGTPGGPTLKMAKDAAEQGKTIQDVLLDLIKIKTVQPKPGKGSAPALTSPITDLFDSSGLPRVEG